MLKAISNAGLNGNFAALSATGDATIGGNVIIGTAGKGIDFSSDPSAPGMTSELLDDYEEGTWTPTLTTMGTDFTSVTYDAFRGGKYTKIGNVVHVQCFMRTDAVTVGAASGQVAIGGLPFVAGASTGGTLNGRAGFPVASPAAWAVNMPSAGLVSSGDARIQLQYRATSSGAFTALAVTDVGTGANANEVFVTGTYIA